MPSKSQKQSKAGAMKRNLDTAPVERPQWPVLRPLVPSCDLCLETILEDQIVLIRKLFTSSLCQSYVSFLSGLPLATTPGVPKKGEALRVNDRFQIEDPEFAERLWSTTALKELVTESGRDWGGEVCGLNPRIRVYRYSTGQFFDQHYDESNVLVLPNTPQTPVKTTWTLLIYLTSETSGCVGGETVFYPELGQAKTYSGKSLQGTETISIAPEIGLALLHKHGNDCLLHEGKTVTAGEKWVIRSDLCVKR